MALSAESCIVEGDCVLPSAVVMAVQVVAAVQGSMRQGPAATTDATWLCVSEAIERPCVTEELLIAVTSGCTDPRRLPVAHTAVVLVVGVVAADHGNSRRGAAATTVGSLLRVYKALLARWSSSL
jgi:hypothetical protein